MNNGLSLIRIISGLSKTLNVARQLIPLYNQVKPIINNSSKILEGINNFNLHKPIAKTENKEVLINNSNNPTFFQ